MPAAGGWEQELNSQIPSPPPTKKAVSLSAHRTFRPRLIYVVPPASLAAASTCLGTTRLQEHAALKVPSNPTPCTDFLSRQEQCLAQADILHLHQQPPLWAGESSRDTGPHGAAWIQGSVLPSPTSPQRVVPPS